MVIEVAVDLQNRFLVRNRKNDDAAALAADIQRRKSAVNQKVLRFFKRSLHRDTKAQQFVAGRPACAGYNLVGVDFVQIACFDYIRACHGF